MGTAQRRDRQTGARALLALISVGFLLLAMCVTLVTVTPAAAAGPVGDCTATEGAVVAVDFGPFGGKVERGCDTTPTTGYDLLHDAGFTTEGTQHDGPGFICRIGFGSGTPYPTAKQEACVLTPPATAYWSYWTASPGSNRWTYSQYGAMSRKLKDGDVDAWVFGGTDIGGSTGKPAFTPDDVRADDGTETPDPGNTPTVPAGQIDLAAAADWVAGTLKDGERVVDDGADTPNYRLTTEALYALAAADPGNADIAKAKAFLAAHTDEYAYPSGKDEAPDATAAARLALVAEATEGDPRDVGGHDLIADLVGHVCPAGPDAGSPPPGCTAKGDFRNAGYGDGQALAVLAVARAGAEPPADAVARLAQLQCEDGGITSILIRPGENCDGDAGTTGLVALALHEAGGQDKAVGRAVAYLKKTQRQDGAFPGYTGATAGSVYATSYAAQALRALDATAHADAAVAWLSREQLDGGGFGFEEDATDPALYGTSPAVLAGAGTDLARLTTEQPGPTDPPTTEPPTTGPSPTNRPTTAPTRPAGEGPDLKKGVAYLTSAANLRQGHYYPGDPKLPGADFGLTIDGAYALAATGLDNDALRGIVDFLDQGGRDGAGKTLQDWTGAGTKYALGGSMGKAALLAEAVGRDPRDFGGKDLIAGLNTAVCEKASKAPDRSCPDKGAYTYAPSVFSQSLAIMAQLRADEKEAAQQPIAYLESLQHDSGAWPSLIPATGDSDVDSTAIAAMALDLAGGEKADKAVDKALAWIAGKQLSDGGFPGAAGDSVNSAALAVQGLSLDEKRYDSEITKALKFLAGQQNPDGGFNVARDGQRGSNLRASAQAVGGATGISFGLLERSLEGTTPQIVTPDDPAGGTANIVDTDGGGGALASTGVQIGALVGTAALLVASGCWFVVVTRRRAEAEGRI
ncbi:prenyltransferase/squalene oxidase-like repeat protein [Streptomyces sp. KhCrAH-43]|uniref:prenyltransferase/squalene oxidase repeat-containing protein n=1 Tax=unclassified Streptomyces TaxID=2593676 RepID=UPI00039CC13C|nr:prenyltransferase/squalene oxidase repeat-containing protein [Streptomyces sp. KhCrAH-43]RAJ58120.1 prenyltransferase/squalene oxidase-like repeat protein [Streptomyces sp. KhCrAH-43]